MASAIHVADIIMLLCSCCCFCCCVSASVVGLYSRAAQSMPPTQGQPQSRVSRDVGKAATLRSSSSIACDDIRRSGIDQLGISTKTASAEQRTRFIRRLSTVVVDKCYYVFEVKSPGRAACRPSRLLAAERAVGQPPPVSYGRYWDRESFDPLFQFSSTG